MNFNYNIHEILTGGCYTPGAYAGKTVIIKIEVNLMGFFDVFKVSRGN